MGIGPIDESQEYQYTPKLIEALQGHSILQIGCGGAFSLVLTGFFLKKKEKVICIIIKSKNNNL